MTISHSVGLTFFSLILPIGSLFFVGLPLATILYPEKTWTVAPFLGLAGIVLFLQSLMYLGVPIASSFYFVWLGVVILWLFCLKAKTLRFLFPIPRLLLLVATVIFLFHSLGMMLIGPECYVGRGWYDQFNYVINSQFLMDHSLTHVNFSDFFYQPALMKAYLFTVTDRIGEDVFEGFIACSLFTNAKVSFEPVILMLPFFVVWVVNEVALRFSFSRRTALIIAALSASLPSVAFIHLESFLSQSLIVPVLLLWPCVLADVFEEMDWGKMIAAGLLLAVVGSVYVEYYVIFLLVMGVVVGVKLLKGQTPHKFFGKGAFLHKYSGEKFCGVTGLRGFRQGVMAFVKGCWHDNPIWVLVIINLMALAFNAGIVEHLFQIEMRALHGRNWIDIYPWAGQFKGLVWFWLGDFAWGLKGGAQVVANVVTAVLLIAAYTGFCWRAYKKRDGFSISICALILVFPLLIRVLSVHQYGYQYYKLLISVSPLLPVGVALILRERFSAVEMGYCFAGIVGFFTLSATLFVVLVSANGDALAKVNRGVGYKLLQADTREVQDKFMKLHGQNLLIEWQDEFRHGDFLNGWLSYFARDNHVWLSNSYLADLDLKGSIASVKTLPAHYLILRSTAKVNGSAYTRVIWQNQTYALVAV